MQYAVFRRVHNSHFEPCDTTQISDDDYIPSGACITDVLSLRASYHYLFQNALTFHRMFSYHRQHGTPN